MGKKGSAKHEMYKNKQSGKKPPKGTKLESAKKKRSANSDSDSDSDAPIDPTTESKRAKKRAKKAEEAAALAAAPLPPTFQILHPYSTPTTTQYNMNDLPQDCKLMLKDMNILLSGPVVASLPLTPIIADLSPSTTASPPPTVPPTLSTTLPPPFHYLLTSLPSSNLNITTLTPIQRTFFALYASTPLPSATLISATGSGKTLAYLLPILDLAKHDPSFLAIVVSPTRELCAQIKGVFKHISRKALHTSTSPDTVARPRKIKSYCITGGVNNEDSITTEDILTTKPSLIVGTPGRLVATLPELAQLGVRPCLLVMDEYDRLLTSNFMEDVDLIKRKTNPGWRWYVSATWKPVPDEPADEGVLVRVKRPSSDKAAAVDAAAGDAVALTLPTHDASSSIPAHITQVLTVSSHHKRPKKLMQLLPKLLGGGDARNKARCIVFFSQITDLMSVNSIIQKQDEADRPYSFTTLHGKQYQEVRNKTLGEFRAAKYQLLLTTDVMARGLDVKGLEYVVNYDFPGNIEQYIHRCGRVGRGSQGEGVKGVVYTYFDRKFKAVASDMLEVLEETNQWVDDNLRDLANGGGGKNKGGAVEKKKKKKKVKEEEVKVEKKEKEKEKEEEAAGGGEKAEEEKEEKAVDWDDGGQFKHLEKRIVFKRAANISDAEDSGDQDEE